MTCIGKDPRCPCQDGDACHYKDCGGTKAWPVPKAEPPQRQWVGLTDEDYKRMSSGDQVVAMWADRTLKERNGY